MFGSRVPDSSTFREAVGQAVIDAIRDQARDGRDKNGKKYTQKKQKTYSKEYADSLEFKAAGKSKNQVTMELTGDMLAFMDVVGQTRDSITIGFVGETEQQKAYGHILGTDPGPKVKRDFFGLPDNKYQDIADDFRLPTEAPTTEEVDALATLTTLRDLFGDG